MLTWLPVETQWDSGDFSSSTTTTTNNNNGQKFPISCLTLVRFLRARALTVRVWKL